MTVQFFVLLPKTNFMSLKWYLYDVNALQKSYLSSCLKITSVGFERNYEILLYFKLDCLIILPTD